MSVHVNDAPWRQLYRRALELRVLKVRVGVLSSKGGAAHHEGTDISLVDLAALHELGSGDGHVPERSFLRSTFYVRVRDQLRSLIADITHLVLERGADVRTMLNRLGAWGAAQVKNTITQNEADSYGEYPYPPLADSTIARKGSSVPLVDTAQMLNAITWEVIDARGKGGE